MDGGGYKPAKDYPRKGGGTSADMPNDALLNGLSPHGRGNVCQAAQR